MKLKASDPQEGIISSVRQMLAAFLPVFVLFYAVALITSARWEAVDESFYWPAMHISLAVLALNVVALRLFGRKTVRPAFSGLVSVWKLLMMTARETRFFWVKVIVLVSLVASVAALKADVINVILSLYAAVAVLFWRGSQVFTLSVAAVAILACPIFLAFGSQTAANQFGAAAFFMCLTAVLREAADEGRGGAKP